MTFYYCEECRAVLAFDTLLEGTKAHVVAVKEERECYGRLVPIRLGANVITGNIHIVEQLENDA